MTIAMQPTLFLQIFSGYLVVSTHGFCGPDEYPITGYPGGKCLPCAKCQEGRGLVPKCGTHIVYQVDTIDCKPCESGEFSDKYDSSSCYVCHDCVENEKVTVPCNSTSDTVCSGTCKKGFYFSKKDGTHSCQKCSHCCFDDQDEEVAECKEQGFTESKQFCAPRPDKDCAPTPYAPTGGKHGSDTSNNSKLSQRTIILIVVGTAAGVLSAVIFAVIFHCRKRRNRATGDCQTNSVHSYVKDGAVVDSQHVTPAVHFSDKHRETVDASPSGTCVNGIEGISALQNEVTRGTSSQDQEIRSAPSVPDVSGVVTIITNSVQYETSAESVSGAEVRHPNSDGGRKHSLNRSLSRDSQKSGDDASGGSYRSRKSSISSLTGTFSKARKQLTQKGMDTCNLVANIHVEEHVDELEQGATWPITIIQQPESQKVKTGANMEFEFKCKANSRLTYQWFKDGTQLRSPEKNNEAILQLKSVKMRDFGCYKCRVSCQDNPIAVVESDAVDLDVTPAEGTKYKSITDVHRQDFQTYERVGCLLSQKIHGLGGWREVAHKYGMDQLSINALRNDPEAGSETLGFLESAVPELTVYDFCKTLKEHHIRRLDIVQELENHFSAPATTFV